MSKEDALFEQWVFSRTNLTFEEWKDEEVRKFAEDGPPRNATPGDLWFNPSDRFLYRYYEDGTWCHTSIPLETGVIQASMIAAESIPTAQLHIIQE